MLWLPFDCEFLDDPQLIALTEENEGYFCWWMRVLAFAKRSNRQGEVVRHDGSPVRALDLALTHHRNRKREAEWARFLDLCVEVGLLAEEEGIFRVVDWRRWHFKPSDAPESTRARKAAERARKRSKGGPPENVTPVTRVTPHNRAEQSKAEQNKTEQSTTAAEHPSHEGLATQVGGGCFSAEPENVSSLPELVDYAQALCRNLNDDLSPGFAQQASEILADADAAPSDLAVALLYGHDVTLDEKGRQTVKKPWGYVLKVARSHLPPARQTRSMTERAKARGQPVPPRYRFDPETEGRTA
ncbi:MAG: hypothetical protein ACH37Z_14915 [Anaerolineae bacterium]